MSIDDLSDDVGELMRIEQAAAPDSALRDAVLADTTSVLRLRRRARRAGTAAALAICYLAGMATMSVVGSHSQTEIAQHNQAPAPVIQRLVTPEDDAQLAAESQAAASKSSAYDRLRKLADRQLDELDDIAAAARTYRKALQAASKRERAVEPDRDTWLLLALKNSDRETFTESNQ
jgi:hypothetical protein